MSNGQNAVRERHLESLAAAVAERIAGSDGIVLPTTENLVDGGFWLDTSIPTVKFYYDGKIYPLMCGESTNPPVPLPETGGTPDDYSWAEISAISQAGKGADYFNIGDTKKITLNGKIGDYLTLDNKKLCVYILHFNYPINGTPDNNIIWGGFKTWDGTDIALCDSYYDTLHEGRLKTFDIDHYVSVSWSNSAHGQFYGGWKGCDFRYDILGATSTQPVDYCVSKTGSNVGYDATAETLTNPKADTLLAALPADFRGALRLWSRWIDAKGGKPETSAGSGITANLEENIEETIDAVTLLTEFEVFGTRTNANQYEQNYQTQMDYFKNGNSTIKYRHNDTSNRAEWWLASPGMPASYYTTVVGYYGSESTPYCSDRPYGLAPAFMT